ncbi:SDR family oxidoreductase [Ectothiorhodospiraceae bacterium WFHF3C12]|nr:SDR family oxidoreductase [Ectothiorhodospiraceae bacterium WFHF3C12]
MDILIAGANGKIGRQLVERLGTGPHRVRAMIRDRGQAAALEAMGADTVLADLEEDVTAVVEGCDLVVFTAGSGPHTGPDKTVDVDRNGAMALIDAAAGHHVRRFIMVSAMRTHSPEQAPEKLRHYLEAKREADDHLIASGMPYTIVRPGRLTNEPGTGRVTAAQTLAEYGEIPRADVAHALAVIIDADNTVNREICLIGGDTPVEQAIHAI